MLVSGFLLLSLMEAGNFLSPKGSWVGQYIQAPRITC